MRALIGLYLQRKIGRRAFLSSLMKLGVAAPAAESLARSLEGPRRSLPGATSPGRILTDKTGGELMAEFLLDWQVPYVFGVGGSEEVGFLDTLVDRTRIQYVLALHEGSVLSMADGYARASRTAAVVNLHSVVGTAYALGPMVNAFKDHTPLVVTAGQQGTPMRGHNAFLESVNLHALPRDYARWTWDVLRADSIPEVLRRAFLLAAAPPGGPAFVTFSKDLWEEKVSRAEILPRSRSQVEAHLEADPHLVSRAAELLATAEFPVIVAGRELDLYGGRAELAEIAELLGAPVFGDIPDSHSPVSFPTTHRLYAGLFNLDPSFPPKFDLFWTVGGTMFTQFSPTPQPLVPRQATVIHAGIDTTEIGRNYPVDLALVANVKRTLVTILRELRRRSQPALAQQRRRMVEDYHQSRQRKLREQAERVWDQRPIASERLAVELNRRIDPDALIISELATSDLFLWNYLDFHQNARGRTHITSSGGCLGWGVGAAVGAKIARPDRQVVLLVGDGSFQFGVQALWSAARYQVPVAVIIWNNNAYQANRRALHRYGGRAAATGKYIGCYLGAPEIDHTAIARGYGIEGERVKEPEELGPALERCFKATASGRAYVLDVRLQPLFEGADSTWYDFFSVASRTPRQT